MKNMKKLTIILMILTVSNSYAQWVFNNIPAPEIKEDGKCKVYYELNDKYEYIPESNLIDWKNSMRRIESLEPIKKGQKYLIEKFRQKKGLKNGEFTFMLTNVKVGESGGVFLSDLGIVMSGEYLNNEFNGIISSLNEINKNKEGYINIEYTNGKIKDQTIKYPELNKDYIGFSFNPVIEFKNGLVSEILSIDKDTKLTSYKKFNGNKCTVIRYNELPLCFNNFSFLDQEYIDKHKDSKTIFINTNKLSLEIYDSKWNGEKKQYLIDGNYRLFTLQNKFLDSSTLVANYFFIDGKRNGQAKIWDINKNGLTGDKPYIQLNYKNDLLEGKNEQYYPDGKLAISASFSKGYPSEVTSYYNYPENKVFTSENKIPQWVVPNGGVLMIDQIGKWSDKVGENVHVNLIKAKGGSIKDLDGHGIYCKINYKTDSILSKNGKWFKESRAMDDFTIYNNGKPMTKVIINKQKLGEIEDIIYKDQTGKVVYSLKMGIQDAKVKENKENKVLEELSNAIIKCEWCNKEVKFKDGNETDWCPCTDIKTNKKTNLVLGRFHFFCSNKCRTEFQKDKCISQGYKYE